MSARAYPLPRPDNDFRFTFDLIRDVGTVLEQHGFPPVNGSDHVALMSAVFGFVYAPESADKQPAPVVEDDSPLTLAEYRDALAYWERKASEAQTAGLRGEFDRRMKGVASLRKTIRRLEGAQAPGGTS